MVNYNNGKIYKIEPVVEHDESEIYIGSTTKKYLSQRMDNHRRSYKQWKNGKHHKITVYDIFEKYNIENCQILLLETVNCNTKDELLAREGHYIKTLKCVNRCITGRTKKEYAEDNKEKISEYQKQYYNDKKQDLLEYRKQYYNDKKQELLEQKKQYYIDNKNKIMEYKKNYYQKNIEKVKEKDKKYQEQNKETITLRQKERYELNKEKILERRKIKTHCEICDCEINKDHIARHNKTLRHQNNLNKEN